MDLSDLVSELPDGWEKGEAVPQDKRYEDPPASPDPTKILIQGLKWGDEGHQYFSIPADTPVADIVRFFEVGSHGAQSYSYDEEETIAVVAGKATALAELIPSRVTFADAAGLKLRFLREVTEDDLRAIEALFPDEEEVMQAGLEGYVSEWDGEGSLFEDVRRSNQFHFWWD
jgi:hypothetical protein